MFNFSAKGNKETGQTAWLQQLKRQKAGNIIPLVTTAQADHYIQF